MNYTIRTLFLSLFLCSASTSLRAAENQLPPAGVAAITASVVTAGFAALMSGPVGQFGLGALRGAMLGVSPIPVIWSGVFAVVLGLKKI